MSPQGYEWRAHWEEHGTRVDDNKIVPIRVGVVEVDGHLFIAISVACAPPVTITGQVAASVGELMQWAHEEHEMLENQDQRSQEDAEHPPAGLADINQAIAWLDDIDEQLSDIATQIRELRTRFPAPPDATAIDTPAEHRRASGDDETEGR
ncbi:MAG: hypothetical protein GEV04_22130 [Actinophytocola sp.]|nr:hypothetical protein [Actinophytocola sp.]